MSIKRATVYKIYSILTKIFAKIPNSSKLHGGTPIAFIDSYQAFKRSWQ